MGKKLLKFQWFFFLINKNIKIQLKITPLPTLKTSEIVTMQEKRKEK